MKITLRPVNSDDQDFLLDVYASTRLDEVSAWGWEAAQQDAFLKMQFMAQQRSYEMQYENPSHDIILDEGEPIGRLLVARTSDEIHLVDISLLQANRGKEIGTALIQSLVDEGAYAGLPVRLEVLRTNRAALLYERLGFVKVGENNFYIQMENPTMSNQLKKETFGENLNTEFRVQLDSAETVNLELVELSEGVSTPRQEQFSLMFRGPLEIPFDQGVRNVEHDKMGAFVLFLVPIARNPDGMVYEAVFNRFVKSDA